MVNKTAIEWTDYSANPVKYRDQSTGKSVWACVRKSPGCAHCYSADLAKRYGRGGEFTEAEMAGYECYLDETELKQMLSVKRLPPGSKCFVGDMTDLFGEWVPFELLDRVFAVFALRPDVVFQCLTKRPERAREYMTRTYPVSPGVTEECSRRAVFELVMRDPISRDYRLQHGDDSIPFPGWPLPNVWMGTSVENQHWADIRIPELLATPAAVRFLSLEPLLGPVDLRHMNVGPGDTWLDALGGEWYGNEIIEALGGLDQPKDSAYGNRIDQVIVGGESGPKARPMDIAWARSIRDQCAAANVAFFMKQVGSKPCLPLTEEGSAECPLDQPCHADVLLEWANQ